MKDEKNYVVPKTIENVIEQIGDVFNRAEKLSDEIDYLREFCQESITVMKWIAQIKKYNPKGVETFNRRYNISECQVYVGLITSAMLDAADLFETEIQRQEEEEEEEN